MEMPPPLVLSIEIFALFCGSSGISVGSLAFSQTVRKYIEALMNCHGRW